MLYDVIIIGRGPAGISASIYTARANLKTLVIGKDDSALKKAGKIENYYGFSEIITGEQLLAEGEKQALKFDVRILDDEVISITHDGLFEVCTAEEKFTARAVLLATGQQRKKLKINKLDEFEGKGVSYCTTCDGFFYRNLKVGVLGYKDFAIHEAMELEAFTKDITIFTNGMKPEFSEKNIEKLDRFKLNRKVITGLEGGEYLEKICFEDGTCENIDGIFVAYETACSLDFARKLGVLTEEGNIIVDKNQQTNIEGLFAAGDCTGVFKQISVAIGQGAIAARQIIEYIRREK